ncbi:AraC family transcriptional regulator [Streptomyces oceani]|uniref:Transcriptional regulator n=1 Tax=Streptomyces oceani TaxID=1075402 RepID=A0A1E7JW98_9ACTN|nr:helix-turn-helix domain-containing protein [Streptomyces oceani]OEU95780.1 transcriptional regulator [Streptomyces oceani]
MSSSSAEHGGWDQFVRAPRTPALDGLVASAIGYRTRDRPVALHRGVPSPYLPLIFSLREPIVTGETAEQVSGMTASRNEIILGPLHQRPVFVRQEREEAGIQLALHPLAARRLLGMPAAELTQLAGDGAEILGSRAAGLRERMCELEDWDTRFAELAGFLLRRAEDGAGGGPARTVRAEVVEAWRWLAWHRGAGSMDGLATHVAMSRRQLGTLFQREVGMSPKQVSRLMRFENARQVLARDVRAGRSPDLAGVAARCGFYDHSHLVRDFRQYTGLSPSGWLSEEHRNIQAGGHHNGEEWDP